MVEHGSGSKETTAPVTSPDQDVQSLQRQRLRELEERERRITQLLTTYKIQRPENPDPSERSEAYHEAAFAHAASVLYSLSQLRERNTSLDAVQDRIDHLLAKLRADVEAGTIGSEALAAAEAILKGEVPTQNSGEGFDWQGSEEQDPDKTGWRE